VLFSMLPIGGAQRTLRDLNFGGGNSRKMRYSSVILHALCLLVVLVPLPSPSNADAAKADLLSRESNELRAQGKYVEAVEKARQAVDEAKNAGLENNSPWVYATYLYRMGDLHIQVNDFDKASEALKRALEIRKSADPDEVLPTSNALGRLYQDMGRFDEAEPLLAEVARLYGEKLSSSSNPADRERLASAQSSLGAFYRETAKFDLAEQWLKSGLQLRERLPADTKDPYIANSKFQLAALYRDQAKYRTAESFARDAVDIWGQAPGNQQLLASALVLYADILRAEGLLQEAETQVRRGIEIRKKEFGGESLKLSAALNVFGAVLESLERLGDAEAAYREALRIRTARLPGDHPDLATSQARLGGLLKATTKLTEAEPLLESALKIREKKLGAQHPDTVKSLDALGDLMRRRGRPDKARELFEKADPYRKSSVHQIRVLFGTNREEERADDLVLRFGRAESKNQTLTVGIAEVLVPDVHVQGVTQASVLASGRPPPEDVTSADRMNIREVSKKTAAELISAMRSQLAQSQLYSGKALVFLHGFNTSFNNALVRAAQLAYDLQFDGPVVAFSWPSMGGENLWDDVKNILNYTPDRTSAANARLPLARFLKEVLLPAGPTKIAFIAHSMGNRVLLETLSDASRTPQDGIGTVVGDLVFAAPDVPRSEFRNFLTEIRDLGTVKTLYATRNDRALRASRDFWHEAPAGLIQEPPSWWQVWKGRTPPGEPVSAQSVEAIDVSAAGKAGPLNFLNMNHDFYATNLSLIEDMRSVIRSSLHPPHRRNEALFVPTHGTDGDYWVFQPAHN
jgi:esterase/lipase superfamily enzyme